MGLLPEINVLLYLTDLPTTCWFFNSRDTHFLEAFRLSRRAIFKNLNCRLLYISWCRKEVFFD
jgi:hypothetical protein